MRHLVKIIFLKLFGPFLRRHQLILDRLDRADVRSASVMSILSVNNPITNCPQAHGTLRKIQQAKTKVLFAFDRFCKENGLAYWLHAGTHLGAVRHGGFIPWDDDIDVAMMRDDFDRFIGIVGRMPQNGKIRYYWCGGFIKIKYTEKDFVLDAVDVFPFHQYYKRTDISDAGKLKQRIAEYITPNHILSAPLLEMPYHGTCAEMKTMREKIMEGKSPVVDGDIFAVNCNKNIFRYEWIFPLSVIPFEGRKLSAPNNADNVLESQFGDFMAYPPDMYFGHGSVSDNLMHNWRNYEKLDGFLSMDAAFIYELMAGVKK